MTMGGIPAPLSLLNNFSLGLDFKADAGDRGEVLGVLGEARLR